MRRALLLVLLALLLLGAGFAAGLGAGLSLDVAEPPAIREPPGSTAAMVSGPAGSRFALVLPDEPGQEAVCSWRLESGRPLGDEADEVLLGAPLAGLLAVELGDEVVVAVESRGELETDLRRVVGLVRSGEPFVDRHLALVPPGSLPADARPAGSTP